MNKAVRTAQLFFSQPDYLIPLFECWEYPWQIFPELHPFLEKLITQGLDGFERYRDDILVGAQVQIHPSAALEGPAIIGSGTEIRPGAYLRGNVVTGKNCVIGNSSELKNSILLDQVQVPHYNYVGDSILGNRVHMGAGSICSNLKSDHNNVIVHADRDYETGLRKLGAILADGADIGCGCVLNPGTVIGQNTSVYPLTALRGVYPANCIVKAAQTVIART